MKQRHSTYLLVFVLLGCVAARPPIRKPPATKPAQAPAPAAKTEEQPVATDNKPAEGEPAISDTPILQLPAPLTEFHAAAGGKKIVIYIKSLRKLFIADVIAHKLIGEIPVPADNARFACSNDRILLVLPDQRVMQTYDLATLKRLKTGRLPDDRPLKEIRMGCTSIGPAYLWFGGELIAVNPATLDRMKLEGKVAGGDEQYRYNYRVSADGNTVTSYQTGISPVGYEIMHLHKNAGSIVGSPESYSMANRSFTPTADGSFILYGGTVYDREGHVLPSADLKEWPCTVTTADPRFFLAVRPAKVVQRDKTFAEVGICTTNDRRVLGVIPFVGDIVAQGEWDAQSWGIDGGSACEPRLILLTNPDVLAIVRRAGDAIEVRPFSMKSMMTDPDAPGLAVISLPPSEIALGRPFAYKIETLPENAATQCKLESGPDGMTVSPTGEVGWRPKDRPLGGKADVIVSVADAGGHEVMHSFSLSVVRAADLPAPPARVASATPGKPGATTSPRANKPASPTASPEPDAPPAPAPSSKIVKLDDHRIELPSPNFRFRPGLNNKSTLLLCGDQLAVLAPDGFTITQTASLPKPYVAIAERERYYIALSNGPSTIELLDKKTLKVTKSRVLPDGDLSDIVLHPTRPIAYVTQKTNAKPMWKFIIVEEATLEAQEDEKWIAQWLAIAPGGDFLVAGYHDIYQDGHDIIDNPDRIWIVPKYGSLDFLIRYDLRDDGVPRGDEMREQAGGNGTGIRLSGDGKRVTYLSHVGSPSMSNNLSGWDPRALSKVPVAYATKDRASTQEAAFHPSLPILATPGKGTVVFFDRESGGIQDNRVKLDDLKSSEIVQVFFSPDGRQLIADTVVNAIHYLYHTPLNLNDEETKQLQRVAPSPKARPKGEKPLAPGDQRV